MEQTPWIISIASPIIACVVFYLKKDKESSTKVTSTLLDAYVKNLDRNSELVSSLAKNLDKSTESLDNIENNQKDIKNNQIKIIVTQDEILEQNKRMLRELAEKQ